MPGAAARGASACVALAIWAGLSLAAARGQDPPAASPPINVPQAVADLETVVSEVVARAERSVVSIIRVRTADAPVGTIEPRFDPFDRAFAVDGRQANPLDSDFVPNGFGTGVVIDAAGLIVTNFHVVDEENSEFYVTTVDRRPYKAKIKAADPRSDLAVLEVAATDLVPMPLGDAATVRKGQFVIALGNPYAIARDGQVSASWGIVANLGRKVIPPGNDPRQRSKLQHLGGLIQTDARLNLGTSGGALVNLRGEMIGLTTSLAAMAGYEQSAGYALPVDDAFRRIVSFLKEGREVEYGFLGVAPMDLSADERIQGRHGAKITEVVAATPAWQADLREEDIITAVNGEAIFDKDGLFLRIGNLPVEAVVRLTVERAGQTIPISVELAKSFVMGRKVVTQPAPSWRGLSVDFPTALPNFQDRLREDPFFAQGGVVVTDVATGSPAEAIGIRAGVLITHVDGVRVHTPREFWQGVENKAGRVQLRLGVKADEQPERALEPEPAAS